MCLFHLNSAMIEDYYIPRIQTTLNLEEKCIKIDQNIAHACIAMTCSSVKNFQLGCAIFFFQNLLPFRNGSIGCD